MITPCPCTRHCWSGAPQLPCPGSLQPQYIHLAEMCLQEETPKIPSICIHPQPCINLAKAQKSATSNEPMLRVYFCGCILFIYLPRTGSRTVKSIIILVPSSQALLIWQISIHLPTAKESTLGFNPTGHTGLKLIPPSLYPASRVLLSFSPSATGRQSCDFHAAFQSCCLSAAQCVNAPFLHTHKFTFEHRSSKIKIITENC